MRSRLRRLTMLGLVIGLAACMNRPLVQVDPVTESFVKHEMTQVQFSGVDILVVVDNSMSMAEEQANLARNFPELIRTILDPEIDPETGRPSRVPVRDMHIGVISTDMGTAGYAVETCHDSIDGDDGVLQHEPNPELEGCDRAFPDYLSYASPEPDASLVEQMSRDFSCLAPLGIDGCGFEQPLKAAVRALGYREDGENAGFLRHDSLLVVLFVTDEDDCSVASDGTRIFDTMDSSLGHLSLRCFHHPYFLESVETYVDTLRTMRSDPDMLLVSFVVGVPMDEQCQGRGDQITRCLEHPAMLERIDPVSMTRLTPVCVSRAGEAYAARRLVEIAQALGENALVHSICDDDLRPAVSVLTDRLVVQLQNLMFKPELPHGRDPGDDCRCETRCHLVEVLDSDRACPPGKPCVTSTGPTRGCRIQWLDGTFRSLCRVPETGTRTSTCGTGCGDPDQLHAPDLSHGGGWYYMGTGWSDEPGGPYHEPTVEFTEGMKPEDGSTIFITCETCLGEPTRMPVTGGEIGTPCFPETCPPLYDDMGVIIEGACGWKSNETYIAEAEECLGGACLAFRVETGLWEPYCSRRCGRSGGGACPGGYECVAAYLDETLSPGCYCVYEGQLLLTPGSADTESIRACR